MPRPFVCQLRTICSREGRRAAVAAPPTLISTSQDVPLPAARLSGGLVPAGLHHVRRLPSYLRWPPVLTIPPLRPPSAQHDAGLPLGDRDRSLAPDAPLRPAQGLGRHVLRPTVSGRPPAQPLQSRPAQRARVGRVQRARAGRRQGRLRRGRRRVRVCRRHGASCRCVRPRLRAFTDDSSSRPPSQKQLGIKHAHLVGADLGAMVALRIAAEDPSVALSVSLLGPLSEVEARDVLLSVVLNPALTSWAFPASVSTRRTCGRACSTSSVSPRTSRPVRRPRARSPTTRLALLLTGLHRPIAVTTDCLAEAILASGDKKFGSVDTPYRLAAPLADIAFHAEAPCTPNVVSALSSFNRVNLRADTFSPDLRRSRTSSGR